MVVFLSLFVSDVDENVPINLAYRVGRQRLYTCQDCGKVFDRPSSLVKHEHRHTGARPHGCHLCGKMFSQSSSLYRHIRVNHSK